MSPVTVCRRDGRLTASRPRRVRRRLRRRCARAYSKSADLFARGCGGLALAVAARLAESQRDQFLEDPETTLVDLSQLGFDLSRTEIAALLNTDRDLWERAANDVDPRLLKISFKKLAQTSVAE